MVTPLRDAVPGSRLEVLAGLGHFPHAESPIEVARILDDFIANTDPGADVTAVES